MPQSLSNVPLHIVYSTKNQWPFLQDRDDRGRIHAYMAGICQGLNCSAITIGGVADHVHVLCNLSRSITIADLLRDLKKESSKWIKPLDPRYRQFSWQGGYAVFAVSQSRVERVKRYIDKQEDHHRRMSFKEELLELLKEHDVRYDDRYLWD